MPQTEGRAAYAAAEWERIAEQVRYTSGPEWNRFVEAEENASADYEDHTPGWYVRWLGTYENATDRGDQ